MSIDNNDFIFRFILWRSYAMKDTEVKKESMIKKYSRVKKDMEIKKEGKTEKEVNIKKEIEVKRESKTIEQEYKYPVILCNLSTSASNDRFSSVTGDYLCILYKDEEGKAKYHDIDMHNDINLIIFNIKSRSQMKEYLFL